MRKIICPVLFILLTVNLLAQNDLSVYHTHTDFDTTKTNQLLFQIENHNFFRNNEYFSDLVEGYTLPGYTIEPALVYYPSSLFRLKAGFNFRQFHGTKSSEQVMPVISAQLMLTRSLSVTLGAIRGSVHHNMPEPLIDPEWQINRPVETGLQFLLNTSRFKADLWLDWNQFIKTNDTIPEKFLAGFKGNLRVNQQDNNILLSIPLMMTATHRGGQISNFNEPMESLANLGTGIIASKNVGTKALRKTEFSLLALYFKDLTDKKERPMNSGFAVYPTMSLTTLWGDVMAGWWYGNDFYSPRGNPQFMSTSTYKPGFYQKERNMITLKYNLNKMIMKQLKFNFGVEGYIDTATKTLEYFYAINIIYSPSFKLMTLNHLE